MRTRVRKSAAYSVPVLIFFAVLIWIGPPRTTPAAPSSAAGPEQEEAASAQEAAARAAGEYEDPVPLLATGGPYRDAEEIRVKAIQKAASHGAENPEAESIRFMRYGEAVELYHTGWSTRIDLGREVYVVSVPGRVTVGHHIAVSYARSFYIFDASTGELIQFGARDLP
jgi:hypothetical protein